MMLDGPRLAARESATGLIVLLHGYGADGHDLIDIGAALQPYLPDFAFVSPHAPFPCGMAPHGREWFPLLRRDPPELKQGTMMAAPLLGAFLDAELTRLGLDDQRLALIGFSQGTMMALHVGLRRKVSPAAIIGYSGALVAPENLHEAAARPTVTLVHGDQDQVIPIERMFASASALREAGISTRFHVRPRLGHGIDQQGLAIGLAALKEAFDKEAPQA